MSSFNEVTKEIAQNLTEHSSELKVASGLIAGAVAFGLGIWGTVRTCKEFERKKPKTKKQKALIIAKNIGPAALAEVASVALIISGEKEALAEASAATLSAAIANEALQRRIEATKECTDEKTVDKINSKVAEKSIEKAPISNRELVVTGRMEQIFQDELTGRYFVSSKQEVLEAFNRMNKENRSQGYLGCDEYFYELGLTTIGVYDHLGWIYEIDGELEPRFVPKQMPDGRTCNVIMLDNPPDNGYWKMSR